MLKRNIVNLFLVLIITFCLMMLFLVSIDYVSDPPVLGIIGASSIGSSIFIIIIRPFSVQASNKNILGGYLISIVIGIVFHYLIHFTGQSVIEAHNLLSFNIFAASSIVVTVIVFLIGKFDHPPAVGMTLGLVLEHWTLASITIVIIALIMMLLIKMLLKRREIIAKQ